MKGYNGPYGDSTKIKSELSANTPRLFYRSVKVHSYIMREGKSAIFIFAFLFIWHPF